MVLVEAAADWSVHPIRTRGTCDSIPIRRYSRGMVPMAVATLAPYFPLNKTFSLGSPFE